MADYAKTKKNMNLMQEIENEQFIKILRIFLTKFIPTYPYKTIRGMVDQYKKRKG